MSLLGANARALYDAFSKVPELTAIMPRGAMYMMVQYALHFLHSLTIPRFQLGVNVEMLENIHNDVEFVEVLLKEACVSYTCVILQGGV